MAFTKDDYIPLEHFGRDHWSTMAYIETVEVDCKGFQVGYDPHMRANRRNFRVMSQQCPKPKRTHDHGFRNGEFNAAMVMDLNSGSRLKDGSIVVGHDDWCCVQDLALAGFFGNGPEEIEPGGVLHLSEVGRAMVAELRSHKATGGSFSNFQPASQACGVK